MEDWACVDTVSEPFSKGYNSSTFSLRMCWSPEGRFLAAVNSFDSSKNMAVLLDRSRSWTHDYTLIGHSGENGSLIAWVIDTILCLMGNAAQIMQGQQYINEPRHSTVRQGHVPNFAEPLLSWPCNEREGSMLRAVSS